MYKSAFENNPYVSKVYLTGITRVAQANLFSSLNNFKEYGVNLNEN